MKRELYGKSFDRAAFPIVAADKSGGIVYKNPAAGKYLPALRRGADIVRRLHGKNPLHAGMDAEVMGDTPYRRAAVLQDDDTYVFLFLSRLQYPDGEEEARSLTDHRGTTLDSFLAGAACAESLPGAETRIFRQSRVYTDLIDICENENLSGGCVYDVCELFERLSSKLKGAFRSLGYRITMNIDAAVRDRTYAKLNLYDFIFIFSKLLYMQMKLSENGIVNIEAKYDDHDEQHALCFSARTGLTKRCIKSGDTVSFLSKLAPECALEFELFENAVLLSQNTHVTVDKYGKFVMEYRLKSIENASVLHVRSIELETVELDTVIDRLILGIKKEMKNIRPI